MAPILATEPTITRTAEPPPDVRPVEPGHCYRCGMAPCLATLTGTTVEDDGACNRALAEPLTLAAWLDLAVHEALRGVFGTGFPLVRLDPETRRLTAELVRQIGERIARRY